MNGTWVPGFLLRKISTAISSASLGSSRICFPIDPPHYLFECFESVDFVRNGAAAASEAVKTRFQLDWLVDEVYPVTLEAPVALCLAESDKLGGPQVITS